MDDKRLNALITGRINEYIAEMHNFSLSGKTNEDIVVEYLQELQELVDVCNEKSKELECALKALLNALNKK
jgi:hypothetical protein